MADRIPLIVNASAGQIQELGAVDPLVGITTVSMSGPITITDNTASTNKTTGAVVVTGGVGIGGALNVGGDITAFSTSDETLKENLVTIPNAVDKVKSVSGYTFKWKADGPYVHLNGKEDIGVIAQQIEALGLPGTTSTRDDGIKGVAYKKLVPLLIEAIKELDARIKTLEG